LWHKKGQQVKQTIKDLPLTARVTTEAGPMLKLSLPVKAAVAGDWCSGYHRLSLEPTCLLKPALSCISQKYCSWVTACCHPGMPAGTTGALTSTWSLCCRAQELEMLRQKVVCCISVLSAGRKVMIAENHSVVNLRCININIVFSMGKED